MQVLRSVPAQSKCTIDVDVQVSFCCDNKNLHIWVAYNIKYCWLMDLLLYLVCFTLFVMTQLWLAYLEHQPFSFWDQADRYSLWEDESTRPNKPLKCIKGFCLMWCQWHPLISHWPEQVRWPSWEPMGCAVLCPERSAEKASMIPLQKRELILGNNNTIYYSWKLLLASSSASKFLCTILFKAML